MRNKKKIRNNQKCPIVDGQYPSDVAEELEVLTSLEWNEYMGQS